MLVDVTRCNGCNRCLDICVSTNRLGEEKVSAQDVGDGLSANRWSAIIYHNGHPVRKFCRHCLEPACVSVCPVGAMEKTPAGPVIYHYDKCMGCRYCMMACPFGIPRYEWSSPAPRVQKCNLCIERLNAGQTPACAEACPEQALIFGERDVLLETAHRRIKENRTMYQPNVYGELEAGGTSVLYISNIPLDFLSLSQTPSSQPLPNLSWNWLSKVPTLGFATAGLMTGLYWIIGQRMMAEEARRARRQKEH